MTRVAVVTLAAMLYILSTTPAAAQYEVPGPLAVKFQVEAHQLGEYTDFVGIVGQYNYSYLSYVDMYLGTSPNVTTWDLIDVYMAEPGWLWIMSHSRSTSFDTEPYEYTAEGRTARDAAWTQLKNVYGSDRVFRETRYDNQGNPEYYTIIVTEGFIQDNLQAGENMHVMHAGCGGWPLKDGYLAAGVRSYVSYSDTVTNYDIFRHANTLYSKVRSPSIKTIKAAVAGIDNRLNVHDPAGTVLAPRVASVSLVPNSKISQPTVIGIRFDASMRQVSTNDCIFSGGAIRVRNAQWIGLDLLQVEVYGAYKGPGSVILDSYNPNLVELSGLMSTTGIGLDGNMDPWPNVSGIPPNGDDEVIPYTSTIGGDNPAAAITAFTAIDAGAGVTLTWNVEFENLTERYRIDRSHDWSGPFEAIADVLATGAHHYTVSDPSGTSDYVYRLVEIETTGRELKQAEEQATAPFTIAPDMTVTEVFADSLRRSMLERYPAQYQPDQTQPMFEWLAVIPDESYRDYITPSVNDHQAQGMTTAVMTLAEIGGPVGIQPFVRWASQYGLRYLNLCGDGNNWRDHDDQASYYGGYVQPAYPSQSEYDLIPMSASIPDPVGNQLTGLPYFTSRFSTDALYGDIDGDSLADIAVSRWPCRSPEELLVMSTKSVLANHQPATLGSVGFWGEFRNLSGNDGAFAQMLCDSLVTKLPPGTAVRKLYNTESAPIQYAYREMQALMSLNEGRSIIMTFGTQSNRAKWAMWLDRTQGFGWHRAPSNTRLFYLAAPSCDILDFDRSEDPMYGRPLFEEGLLYLDRGPYAGWGLSRGSWQHDDFMLAGLFYDFAFKYGASSGAEAMMLTAREYGRRGPEFKYQALEMVHFGDAAAFVPGMVINNTTAVGGDNGVQAIELFAPFPNPVRATSSIRYRLPTSTSVKLTVIDVQGRVVHELVSEAQSAGVHTVNFTTDLNPGMYFLRFRAGTVQQTQKMLVIR